MQGAFLWGRRAVARCLAWQPRSDGGTINGQHDGYTRLKDPVLHRRTVDLDGSSRRITIDDELLTAGTHSVQVYFHLAEQCRATRLEPNLFRIDTGPGELTLEIDPRLDVRVDRGATDPIAGWVSRGYHRKTPAITLTGRCICAGGIRLRCRLTLGAAYNTERPLRR